MGIILGNFSKVLGFLLHCKADEDGGRTAHRLLGCSCQFTLAMSVFLVISAKLKSFKIALCGKCQQRPGVSIAVVFQVKNARESSACSFVFRPTAIAVLRVQQEFDAASDAIIVRFTERLQSHYRPGSL